MSRRPSCALPSNSPRLFEVLPQVLVAEDFAHNPFISRWLRKNSSYLYENEEFGGRGVPP